MEEISPETFKPVGTVAVMSLLALLIAVIWLWMYFGVLLKNQSVGGIIP